MIGSQFIVSNRCTEGGTLPKRVVRKKTDGNACCPTNNNVRAESDLMTANEVKMLQVLLFYIMKTQRAYIFFVLSTI